MTERQIRIKLAGVSRELGRIEQKAGCFKEYDGYEKTDYCQFLRNLIIGTHKAI